jgi:flagellar biosynthesis protein FlhF
VILKTYRAHDLQTALAQARSELGADALVLARSEVPGPFGLPGVELTVAAARAETPALPAAVAAAPVAPSPPPPPAPRPLPAPADETPLLRASAEALVHAGLSRDLAQRYASIAARDLDGRTDAARVAAAAAKAIETLLPFAAMPGGGCQFVVGPPGSGKTTTVAKLVARLAAEPGRTVFFGEADTDRIGSVEQAEIFARHMGAVLARIDGPADLERALYDADKTGAIVVDTPGIGAGDALRLRRVAELREVVPEAGVIVLLPAGLHRDEAERVLDRFAGLGPTAAGLTRTDDGARVGELVSALAERGLPLAFVTTGHAVPDDLEHASARGLTALLLRSGGLRARERARA